MRTNIKLDQSNFVSSSNRLEFSDGAFKYFKASEDHIIMADQIKSVNRARKKSIGSTDTNIFKNVFLMGASLALASKLFGVKKSIKPMKQRLVVHFKDGKYFSGYTDVDSFFDVQNAWLDAKAEANKS